MVSEVSQRDFLAYALFMEALSCSIRFLFFMVCYSSIDDVFGLQPVDEVLIGDDGKAWGIRAGNEVTVTYLL